MKKIKRRDAIKSLGSLAPAAVLVPAFLSSGCRTAPRKPAAGQPERKARAFKRSDVVFAFVFTPEEYKAWHANILFGWCGGPATREEIPKYVERQQKALDAGVRMGASISGFAGGWKWFKERDANWQDALWRNQDGKLITYPWVRPPDPFPAEKGEICTNHPRFLEKKFAETELAMASKPFAFHIDDPLGTATELGIKGCFCTFCIRGFRDYLKKTVAPETLMAAGVADLESFDYREFLKGRNDRPLWQEFSSFQLRSSVEHVKKICQFAREKRGAPLPMGANAPVVGAHIVFAPYLDYIAAEVGTDGKEMRFGAKPMLNYKMGDAMGLAVAATGIYQDWVMLWKHDIPDLVRGWVAESYALGGNFIVPHKEWGFIQPPGKDTQSIAYPGKPELIGPLYKFVRDHPELFDDYEAVTEVGLLYDYGAMRTRGAAREMPQTPEKRPAQVHEICLALADANVQFGMLVAGSEPLDHELTAKDLKKYGVVVTNGPVMAQGRQKELLEEGRREGKVINWSGIESVQGLLTKRVATQPESGKVWALARVVPEDQSSPLVCHVLNREFDAKAEKMTPQKNVTVSLHRKIFDGRKHEKCTLYMEKQQPRELAVQTRGDMVEVTLPELELWGVLKFS